MLYVHRIYFLVLISVFSGTVAVERAARKGKGNGKGGGKKKTPAQEQQREGRIVDCWTYVLMQKQKGSTKRKRKGTTKKKHTHTHKT